LRLCAQHGTRKHRAVPWKMEAYASFMLGSVVGRGGRT
jgi:hypothetical protein